MMTKSIIITFFLLFLFSCKDDPTDLFSNEDDDGKRPSCSDVVALSFEPIFRISSEELRNPEIKNFQSCSEFKNYITDWRSRFATPSYEWPVESCPLSPQSAPSSYSGTNNQFASIDEEDLAKISGNWIISSKNEEILLTLVDRGKMTLKDSFQLKGEVHSLLVYKERVVAFSVDDKRTWLQLFDFQRGRFVLREERTVPGYFARARLHQGDIVLKTHSYVNSFEESEFSSIAHELGMEQEELEEEDCQNFWSLGPQRYGRFSHLIRMNFVNLDEEIHQVFHEGSTQFYMSEENIILGDLKYDESERLTLAHILEAGSFSHKKTIVVPGHPHNQFSMHEHKKELFLLTEDRGLGQRRIHSYGLLDYEKLAESKNLAPQEDLRSVRFRGDKAYVVTVEIPMATDPLFILDLNCSGHIPILSQLKIDGYSGYLHFWGENHLIGVGREGDNGRLTHPKVSLFDVSNSRDPLLRVNKVFEDSRFSSINNSEWDHHAFNSSGDYISFTMGGSNWGDLEHKVLKVSHNSITEISDLDFEYDYTKKNYFRTFFNSNIAYIVAEDSITSVDLVNSQVLNTLDL